LFCIIHDEVSALIFFLYIIFMHSEWPKLHHPG
jgi:hypothetical protein